MDEGKLDAPELVQANATSVDQEGALGNSEEEQKQDPAASSTATALDDLKDQTKDDSEIVPAMTDALAETNDNLVKQDSAATEDTASVDNGAVEAFGEESENHTEAVITSANQVNAPAENENQAKNDSGVFGYTKVDQ